MSKAEQVALGTTLAGVNQYKVFSAVMTNFNTAIKATNDAIYSQGSAWKENEKYMDSIEARLQSLKAELQKFLLQENILQNAFKILITTGTNVIKFFNTIQGKVILVASSFILLSNSILGTVSKFNRIKASFQTIASLFTSLKIYFDGVIVKAWTAGEAVEAFNAELEALNINPYMLAVAAAIALLAGLVIALEKTARALEEHQKKLEETTSKLDNSKSKIKEYQSSLRSLKDQISEINRTGLDVDKNSDKNIKKLKQEQVELEKLLRLEQAVAKEEQRKANKEAEKVLGSSSVDAGKITELFSSERINKNKMSTLQLGAVGGSKSGDYSLVQSGYLSEDFFNKNVGKETSQIAGLQVATAKMKAYSDEFDKLYAKRKAASSGSTGVIFTEEDQKSLEKAQKNLELASEKASELATNVQGAVDATDGSTPSYGKAKEALDEYYDALDKSSEATKEVILEQEEEDEEIENLSEQIQELASNLGLTSGELINLYQVFGYDEEKINAFLLSVQETQQALSEASTAIDGVQSAFSAAKKAQEEFQETGNLTIDTFQTLLGVSAKYLTSLVDENGQIQMNDSTMEKLIGSMKKAKIEELQQAAAIDVLNYVLGDEENMSSLAKDAIDNLAGKIEKEGNKAVVSAQQNMQFASSVMAIVSSSEDVDEETLNKKKKGIDAIVDAYQNIAERINSIKVDTRDLGNESEKAGNKTSSALETENTLLREQKQLLEEKKKQYDTVVSYIKKKIQDEIKSIEKEKKAQVDAIKEQIDALKDLKKEELDRIQEQIDALKEQKSVEQEFWQNKIDALKEQNDELNTQLEYEELLENLAKAKSKRVRVYKEGQGFVYTEDTNEVDKAQAKVEEFQRKQTYEEQLKILENYKKQSENNYEDQIKALEKLKDEKEKNYEQQIEDLENYQKQIEDQYDARIAYFQEYLDKFTEQTDAYENEQNRQLAIQLTGIDFEQQGWQTRLDNLSNFVEKYNALLGDIHTLDTNGTIKNTTQDPPKDQPQDPPPTQTKKTETAIKNVVDKVGGGSTQKTSEWYAKNYGGKKASGDSSIKEDGFYLVGDSPNQELVIGSKLNGNLMNLTQGSGVVNASSTRTLAGMLNQLGFMGNQGVNMSNSQNKSTNITIGNISLPSVQNGKDFVDYLQNFSLQMTQEAFV